MVSSRGKIRNIPIYESDQLEVVLSRAAIQLYNGKFSVAQWDLLNRATKAMFTVVNKSRKLNLPVIYIVIRLRVMGSTVVYNLGDKLQVGSLN